MLPEATPSSWPLVGRQDELELIERCRARGDGAVVLTGESGVGKSRLAREALARFRGLGARTQWVQATHSAATVPLGAFAGLLPDSARSENPLELLRLAAKALGGSGELVLAIDDAHLLDPSSAALVLELTLSAAVFVVLTVRSAEQCPDAIASVWKDGGAIRLDIGTLDRPQTESLAEEIAGGAIEQSARRWIYQTSLGNALYIRELTRGAQSGGSLTQVHGLWRMTSRPPVSASLAELITARMTGLPRPSERALELIALGEPLPVSEVTTLTGTETLADVEARGLVLVSDGTPAAEVSLSHPLYGEVIRAGLPAFRRRQAQLELAAAIRRRAAVQPRDLIRMARWLTEAGIQMSGETLLQAGRAANLSGDPDLGADLAARAMAAGAGMRAALLLARAHVLKDRYAEAEDVLAAAEPGIADRATAIEYLELQTTVLYLGLRRAGDLRALLARARMWWDHPQWHHHLDTLGLIGQENPVPAAAAAAAEEIYSDQHTDGEVRRRVAPVLASNLFSSGRVRDAYELARQVRPAVPLTGLTDEIAFTLWSAIALESGEGWAELESWASAAVAHAVRLGDRTAAGSGALALGGLRFSQGRFTDASRWLAEAELQLEHRDAVGLLAIVNSMQVGVACFTGRIDAIEPALRRCETAAGADGPLPSQLPYVARARGWALLGRGDLPRAQAALLDAAAQLTETPVYAARLTYEALRAGAPARRLAPRLQHLARHCDGRLTAAYAAHAVALAARDGDALWTVADQMEGIGAVRYATEAAAHTATAYLATGRADAARRAAARCERLHADGQGGLMPPIDGLVPRAVTLTARERQLIDLASGGLSNVEIADRLVLSVRTVESHLYRAMHKLGVTSRRDLPPRNPSPARVPSRRRPWWGLRRRSGLLAGSGGTGPGRIVVVGVLPGAVRYQRLLGQRPEPGRGERGNVQPLWPTADPPGQRLAERWRRGEAGPVAAASHPEPGHVRHRPGDEPAIRAHREQSAAVLGHLARTGQRDLGRDQAGHRREHGQVQRHVVGAEPGRLRPRVHWQRIRLEPAEHQPAPRRAEVHRGIDDAQDRIGGRHLGRRLGDQELVADRCQRDPAAGQPGHLAGPGACRVNGYGGADRPPGGFDPGHPAAGQRDRGGRLRFRHLHPAHPARRQVRPHQAGWLLDVDVFRAPQREFAASPVVVGSPGGQRTSLRHRHAPCPRLGRFGPQVGLVPVGPGHQQATRAGDLERRVSPVTEAERLLDAPPGQRRAQFVGLHRLEQPGRAAGCLGSGGVPVQHDDRPAEERAVQRGGEPQRSGPDHDNVGVHPASVPDRPRGAAA
jgi:DNA-binding CsgD family transcriptional regulator